MYHFSITGCVADVPLLGRSSCLVLIKRGSHFLKLRNLGKKGVSKFIVLTGKGRQISGEFPTNKRNDFHSQFISENICFDDNKDEAKEQIFYRFKSTGHPASSTRYGMEQESGVCFVLFQLVCSSPHNVAETFWL